MKEDEKRWPAVRYPFVLAGFLLTAGLVWFGDSGGLPGLRGGGDISAIRIYRDSVPGVVKIVASDGAGGSPAAGMKRSGTGFVVDSDGTILTNAHVVTPGGEAVAKVRVILRGDGLCERRVEGTVLGTDAATDVAVIKIDAHGLRLRALPLGDSDAVQVGQRVFAIGNPLDYDFSMSTGIVSAVDRVVRGPKGVCIRGCIQTDAAVNEGDSGGPLIDSAGRVIGLNEQIASGASGGIGAVGGTVTAGNIGLAFAVPIDSAMDVLRQLRVTGTVQHPWIGIEGATITPELAALLELPVQAGALLAGVTKGGPFDRAGMRGGDHTVPFPGGVIAAGGDIVTAIDGRTITGMADVVDCIQARKPGDTVTVTYLRKGCSSQATVTLSVCPEDL